MPPLIGNKAVENAAVEWVIEFEKRQGRHAEDTRKKTEAPTDIASPPLLIEVKAFGTTARGQALWLEPAQYAAARDPNFRLYIVENVRQGDRNQFTLRIPEARQLAEMVNRAKQGHYFLLPWPVAMYDETTVIRGT